MSWYMAVVVRGSFVDGEFDETRIGDTLFRLVEAPDAEAAYRRAIEIGEASAEDYADDDGRTIRFRFLGLADLREISASSIGDGTEVYNELIGRKPQDKVVEKRHLTVFQGADEPEWWEEPGTPETPEDTEPPERVEIDEPNDSRFSKNDPIG